MEKKVKKARKNIEAIIHFILVLSGVITGIIVVYPIAEAILGKNLVKELIKSDGIYIEAAFIIAGVLLGSVLSIIISLILISAKRIKEALFTSKKRELRYE